MNEIKLDKETIVCALLGEMIREVNAAQSIEPALKCAARIHKMYTEDQWISDFPNDQECTEWYDINIGNDPEKPCSVSSGIYKFREWLKERSASCVVHKESALKFMTWYNRNEKRSELLYKRFIAQSLPTSPKDTEQLKPLDK